MDAQYAARGVGVYEVEARYSRFGVLTQGRIAQNLKKGGAS